MAMTPIVLFALLCSAALSRGQRLFFRESDFSSFGNMTSIDVISAGGFSDPINVTVRPLTVGQYQALGAPGCNLDSGDDPAELDDFDNSPISKLLFPSNSRSTSSVNFKLTIPEDQVVEREEVFVVLLDVIGAPAVSISRNCTIIRIQEQFFGKLLRWTYNGTQVDSLLPLQFPEVSGPRVIMTVERVVPAELDITITTRMTSEAGTVNLQLDSDYTLNRTFTIPPEKSSVDIVMNILGDMVAEDDKKINIMMSASADGVYIKASESSRTVLVTVLDDEVVNYEFVNTTPEITVVEGESVTLQSGLNPMVSLDNRELQLFMIRTESGSALEGTDFEGVDLTQVISIAGSSNTIMTIFRPGIQPSRSFTVRLLPSTLVHLHRLTHVSGEVTIRIMDNSSVPHVPSFNMFAFANTRQLQLNASWSQEASGYRPVEKFEILIKSCTDLPCTLNPNTADPEVNVIPVSKNNSELLHDIGRSNFIFNMAVCAVNALGRSCSDPKLVQKARPTVDLVATTTTPIIVTANPVAMTTNPNIVTANPVAMTTNPNIVTANPVAMTTNPNIATANPVARTTNADAITTLTTERPVRDSPFILWVIVVCVLIILLCCLIPLILLLTCCCYKRHSEMAYYPGKKKGRKLKGNSPDSNSMEIYMEEASYSDLKYL